MIARLMSFLQSAAGALCREKNLSMDNPRNDFVCMDKEFGTNGNDGKQHTPNQCTALVSAV